MQTCCSDKQLSQGVKRSVVELQHKSPFGLIKLPSNLIKSYIPLLENRPTSAVEYRSPETPQVTLDSDRYKREQRPKLPIYIFPFPLQYLFADSTFLTVFTQCQDELFHNCMFGVDLHLFKAIEKQVLSTFPSQSLSQLFIHENTGYESSLNAQAHYSPH